MRGVAQLLQLSCFTPTLRPWRSYESPLDYSPCPFVFTSSHYMTIPKKFCVFHIFHRIAESRTSLNRDLFIHGGAIMVDSSTLNGVAPNRTTLSKQLTSHFIIREIWRMYWREVLFRGPVLALGQVSFSMGAVPNSTPQCCRHHYWLWHWHLHSKTERAVFNHI